MDIKDLLIDGGKLGGPNGTDIVIEKREAGGREVLIQRLNVGFAYFVPGITPEWRRANNEQHALEFAADDIATGGKAHEWRHQESNSIGPEYRFHLQNQIKHLQAQLNAK